MTLGPIGFVEALSIGTVEFVSPDEIKVLLDIDAPSSVALNTGTPCRFPQVNSYVIIPNDEGFVVGRVGWLAVERSPYPKRDGMRDFGLVDLPYPSRRMSLNPLGMLRRASDSESGHEYRFERGVNAFPSIGDTVLLPTQRQLHSIVASGRNRRVKIGTSPLAGNADVYVDPDRLFGRHLAVLGNTGSGKSCSVAGLIRWSLEAAAERSRAPNARFIVLDPNGEYAKAFSSDTGALSPRVFGVDSTGIESRRLQVPIWFWDSDEWTAFAQASDRTQRPTLICALRAVRNGSIELSESRRQDMRRYLGTIVTILQAEMSSGSPWGSYPKPMAFCKKIETWNLALRNGCCFDVREQAALDRLADTIDELVRARSGQYPKYDFSKPEIDDLLMKSREAHAVFGGNCEDLALFDADTPRPFNGDSLLRSLEANSEMLRVSEYVETMLIRIRTMLADTRMQSVVSGAEGITLDEWLTDYIGSNLAEDGSISIIDLSLVPSDIVHIIAAIAARMVFEALYRYRSLNAEHKTLPTILVMEEAHNFVRRYGEGSETQNPASVCCRVFERIAREGRKFGLGLVLSSQRPSELSPTVLSQCNTFLIHRISNDRDQDLVGRFVPDSLRGLLRDLPTLPARHAILLGEASELPILVRMNELPEYQQPQSENPAFWDVWTGEEGRKVDWKLIADEWQGQAKVSGTANENAVDAAEQDCPF